jgi:rubrerythrin
MQDKSSYGNRNKPLVSENQGKDVDTQSAVQEYINGMVQEIITSEGTFNNQKKKLLKKVVEREGFDYDSLEKDLNSLFALFEDNKKNCSDSIKKRITAKAKACSLTDTTVVMILNKMKSAKPQPSKEQREISKLRNEGKKVFKCPSCGFPVENEELSNRGGFLFLFCILMSSVFFSSVFVNGIGIILGIVIGFVVWLLIPVRYKYKKKVCKNCNNVYYSVTEEIK